MTVQHFVHEPQDFPGTMEGAEAAFQSSPGYSDGALACVPARSAFLRFASPILIIPPIRKQKPLPRCCVVAFSDGKRDFTAGRHAIADLARWSQNLAGELRRQLGPQIAAGRDRDSGSAPRRHGYIDPGRRSPVLARSRVVAWFQESDAGALAFETPSPHLLIAIGPRGAWPRDVEGFLDTLVEFRDILTVVLGPSTTIDR